MKIVMFGHKRIPSREGGVEIVVEQLATRLVKLGNEVTCYNRKGHHISGEEFDKENLKEYKGVIIKNLPTIDKKGLAAFSSSFFGSIKSLFSNTDIVHIHAEGPALFCFIPKLSKKKVIVTIHGLDWKRDKWKASLGEKIIHSGERQAVKHADKIIVLSKGVQKYFKDTYNLDTVFIPNGVNKPSTRKANLIKDKHDLEKDDYILYLGRLVPEKGVHYLIEAFKDIHTNKKLLIAGSSSDSDDYYLKLKDLAKDDKRIIFTGFVEGELLEELYSNSYIYVLPSDLEGMPLSLLEAMSYGNCCLTSNIDECVEVTEDKAITFKKGDITDLRQTLQELINNQTLVNKYKQEASSYICDKYNWDDVVRKTLKVYEDTLSK